MDRVHSNLLIILLGGILLALGGILFVLLVGREEAISAIGGASVAGAFAVALVVGTLALLFIGYVLRKRRQSQPWLFHFILWPAYIGVLAVLGLAAHRAFDKACGRPQECVGQIPLYWLPVPFVLLGALVWWVEDFIIRRRKTTRNRRDR
jgi:CDP-diglyceride synthetase